MPNWWRASISKQTIQSLGVIAVIGALVYFNASSSHRCKEGFNEKDKKILNYQQKDIIDSMKGTVCSEKVLEDMKTKVKDLDKKLQQMKGMNSANATASQASASVSG